MAARRLIILMVVLLVVSTLAATLAPQSEQAEEGSTSSTTTTTEIAPPDSGVDAELVRRTIDSGAEEPRTIRIAKGDQIALVVRSSEPAQIEISGFGLLEDAERDAPARFDLLAERSGNFTVRATTFEQSDRLVGTLAVSEKAEPAS